MPSGHHRDRRWAFVAGVVTVIGGVAALFIHYAGGRDQIGSPEGWFSSIGFAAPFIAAGGLAVIGSLVDAPWQLWASGIALVPCSVVSIVLFPLLIPAVVLIVLGSRVGLRGPALWWGVALAGALVAAFAIIVFHQDPASWEHQGPTSWEGGSSSNVITTTEASISVGVAVLVLVVAVALGRSIDSTVEQR